MSANSLRPETAPLVDGLGRVHTSLRVSVTDRCNIRCFYCMPAEEIQFLPKRELLTFEEIARFVAIVAQLGVNQIRLTGGEPLVRSELPKLVRMLVELPGIDEVALTTNGILLGDQAAPLKEAGLSRLNISLDSLHEATFQKISRRTGLDKILAGIFAAKKADFEKIRLNAVSIHGLTEPDIVPLAEFARQHKLELRFIEFMPLDADGAWQAEQVLSGETIRAVIEREVGTLLSAPRPDESQPAAIVTGVTLLVAFLWWFFKLRGDLASGKAGPPIPSAGLSRR